LALLYYHSRLYRHRVGLSLNLGRELLHNNLLDDINFTGHPAFEGSEANEVLKDKKVAYATWENILRSDEILTEILKTMGFPVVRAKKKK